jgi:hypothetical protein
MWSLNFPEKGREIAAEIEKRVIISPLCSSPPRFEMKVFISGKMILKLTMKKNNEKEIIQKLR